MKTINKIMILVFTCLALSNELAHCFFYNNNGYPSNTLSGAAIGGLAGGRRGAAIGLGVGAGMDMIGAAARNNDRRRYDDDYRYRRSRKSRYRNLEDENAELRARLQEYEGR
jgi:hypothetical protein